MSSETDDVKALLIPLLLADTTLAALTGGRIYTNVPPTQPTLPYLLLSFQPGRQIRNALDRVPRILRFRMEVKAVGKQNDSETLAPICNRLDALLAPDGTGSGPGYFDATSFKVTTTKVDGIDNPDKLDGTFRFSYLGGVYEVTYRPK